MLDTRDQKPDMIQGIYHQLAALEKRHAVALVEAREAANPRDRHQAETAAHEVKREIAKFRNIACDDEILLLGLKNLVDTMAQLPPTPHRMLALRHVEDAQSRLMRELGDQPESES